MLEIEMKFPVPDPAEVERRLLAAGARREEALEEADHYLNAPDRDFARTDEALRLRRIGKANFLTYKGPKLDKVTKTRKEIEVRLGEGQAIADGTLELFISLGYRPVAVVCKRRQLYRLSSGAFAVEACLDQVDGVGSFAELEIQAPEQQLDEGRQALQRLAAELGLTVSERRSYLEMLLAARGEV